MSEHIRNNLLFKVNWYILFYVWITSKSIDIIWINCKKNRLQHELLVILYEHKSFIFQEKYMNSVYIYITHHIHIFFQSNLNNKIKTKKFSTFSSWSNFNNTIIIWIIWWQYIQNHNMYRNTTTHIESESSRRCHMMKWNEMHIWNHHF